MHRPHPIRFLDAQVAIAFPNPVPRRVIGTVVLLVGGGLLVFAAPVAMVALVLGFYGLLVFCFAIACLGALLLGLGIAAVRARPQTTAWIVPSQQHSPAGGYSA